jgi:exodeoxyribonuclease VII large subunit
VDAVTYSVADLGELLRLSLQRSFPDDVWVAGEIRSIRRPNSGHVYFDLIEPADGPGSPPSASVSVVLFKGMRDVVNRSLRSAGGMRIEDGMLVRVRGAVDFYPAQGRLQLRMTGIDPAYTLGAMAAERALLLARLQADGLLDANAGRELPPVPVRLALVTSHGSAAAADFLNELSASGHAWVVRLVDTVVQGVGADRSIAGAIVLAGRLGVDAVAVVRGGGSRTDLVCFDSELVARAIAACPVPVLTGIGHEIDRSIADEVAHTATKTPTACAAALVTRVRAFTDALDAGWDRLHRRADAALGHADTSTTRRGRHAAALARTAALLPAHVLGDRARSLDRRAGRALDRAQVRLDDAAGRAAHDGRRALHAADHTARARTVALVAQAGRPLTWEERRLGAIEARLGAVDPAQALARGWSITRRADGTLVRSPDDVAAGETMQTTTAGGTVTSTVADGPAPIDRAGGDRDRRD